MDNFFFLSLLYSVLDLRILNVRIYRFPQRLHVLFNDKFRCKGKYAARPIQRG